MLKFKQWLNESTKKYEFTHRHDPYQIIKTTKSKSTPTVIQIAKINGAKKGKDDGGYWAYAGRCYEFRDQLHHNMKEAGYKNIEKQDSQNWARHGHGNDTDFNEILWHGDNNHAWIEHEGKHYDSMNPEGVEHPSKLNFFKGILKNQKKRKE